MLVAEPFKIIKLLYWNMNEKLNEGSVYLEVTQNVVDDSDLSLFLTLQHIQNVV